LKILHVSPSYYPAIQFGGPIQSVHLLNKELVAQGVQVDVFTTNAGLNEPAAYKAQNWHLLDGVRVKYFHCYGYIHYNFSSLLSQALRRHVKEYDLVHITAVWNFPVWAAAFACRQAGVPYILSPRGTIYPETVALKSTFLKQLYYRLIARKCLQGASAIHYTAADEQNKVNQFLKLTTPAFVIPNGLNLSTFAALDYIPAFSTFFPELADKRYLLFLSRINIKKGLDILVDAFAEVSSQFPDLLLVIAGPDNEGYGGEVKARLRSKGILGKTFFPGMLSGNTKLAAYRDADMFVLPSYSENFGMSVVEAMACGTPVLISDQVGISPDVQHWQAGIVIPAQSKNLAAAITGLLRDDAGRQRLRINGLKMVSQLYSIEAVAQAMVIKYEYILHKSQQPASVAASKSIFC
jgi:glycosyltransferase involved in cell wall biosynthesis